MNISWFCSLLNVTEVRTTVSLMSKARFYYVLLYSKYPFKELNLAFVEQELTVFSFVSFCLLRDQLSGQTESFVVFV